MQTLLENQFYSNILLVVESQVLGPFNSLPANAWGASA